MTQRQPLDPVSDLLIRHRWMGSLGTCFCQYGQNGFVNGGKEIQRYSTVRLWAEHVSRELASAGLVLTEDGKPVR